MQEPLLSKAKHHIISPDVPVCLFLSSATLTISVDVREGHRAFRCEASRLRMDAGLNLFFYSVHAGLGNMTDILITPPYAKYHYFHQPEPISISMVLINMLLIHQ